MLYEVITGHVLARGEGFVGSLDAGHQVLAFAAEGLGLEILGDENRSDEFGVLVQAEHLLHEEGVLVAGLAAALHRHGADGLEVANLQVLLLEPELV